MTRALKLQDPTLFGLALITTILGLVFVFDAGYARSLKDNHGAIPHEFLFQILFLPVAIGLSAVCANVRPDKWQKWSKAVWLIALLALVAAMTPGLRVVMSGAHRWVKLGPVLFQPAEFAKLGAIVYLAGVLAVRPAWPSKIKPRRSFPNWLDTVAVPKLKRAFPAIWVLVAIVLIEKEPDLGTAAVIGFTAFVIFATGGATRKSILLAIVLALVGGAIMVKQEPYRWARVVNHSDRWSVENIDDTEYQTVQSELAIASGGITGTGIGSGRAKHVLPATTTDFVFATIGEEFGLVGSFLVIGLIGGIAIRLFMLAPKAPTRFGTLVLVGVGSWIGVQACTNIMMANGTLPAIGIPLPFISSGGSSLIALWMALGLCQAALAPVPEKEEARAPSRHRRWNRRPRLSRA